MTVTTLPEKRASTDSELTDLLASFQDFQKEARSSL
jgi:hypothetical protein